MKLFQLTILKSSIVFFFGIFMELAYYLLRHFSLNVLYNSYLYPWNGPLSALLQDLDTEVGSP